jgi:hypothetical protein
VLGQGKVQFRQARRRKFTQPLSHERRKKKTARLPATIILHHIPFEKTINGIVAVINPPPRKGS